MKQKSRDYILVGVVVGIVDESLVLDYGIVPTVVNTQRNQVDFLASDAAACNLAVLALNVASKLRAIVATIRLCEDSKVTRFVLGKLLVESLQECPDVWSSGNSTFDVRCTIGVVTEASA